MTTNTTAPAALFSAAELVEDLLGGIATEDTIVEEVTVVAITPAQLAELADTLDAEETPVTDTPADDRPALTLTHYAVTATRPGELPYVFIFPTEDAAATFPERDPRRQGSTYSAARKVETTYRVGDKVTVRAFGQPNRPGTVTKLGRTKVAVDFLRNRSGQRHEGTFSATDVRHA